MDKRIKAAAALTAAGVLALSGCSGDSNASSDGGEPINYTAFSIMEAANEIVFEDFKETDQGTGVEFEGSYGPSGDQSRAVLAGSEADVVHFSLEPDVTRLSDEGIIAEDWKDNATNGIATSSVVVIVTRAGNPEGIEGWDDIVEPGIEIITPNPGSSGGARWNILAAWAHATAESGSEEDGVAFLTKLLQNTIALPGSAREATTAFTDGSGDVLLSYENEAILAKQSGADIDYIVPDDTLLIENPAAVTTEASDAAQSFLEYMTSPEAQSVYAGFGLRPVVDGVEIPEVEGANDPSDPFPTPGTLFTIDEQFNGWGEANGKYFGDGEEGNPLGIITKLQQDLGKEGEE